MKSRNTIILLESNIQRTARLQLSRLSDEKHLELTPTEILGKGGDSFYTKYREKLEGGADSGRCVKSCYTNDPGPFWLGDPGPFDFPKPIP
jgi:hypothetical protein